jgi:hypothetical protein
MQMAHRGLLPQQQQMQGQAFNPFQLPAAASTFAVPGVVPRPTVPEGFGQPRFEPGTSRPFVSYGAAQLYGLQPTGTPFPPSSYPTHGQISGTWGPGVAAPPPGPQSGYYGPGQGSSWAPGRMANRGLGMMPQPGGQPQQPWQQQRPWQQPQQQQQPQRPETPEERNARRWNKYQEFRSWPVVGEGALGWRMGPDGRPRTWSGAVPVHPEQFGKAQPAAPAAAPSAAPSVTPTTPAAPAPAAPAAPTTETAPAPTPVPTTEQAPPPAPTTETAPAPSPVPAGPGEARPAPGAPPGELKLHQEQRGAIPVAPADRYLGGAKPVPGMVTTSPGGGSGYLTPGPTAGSPFRPIDLTHWQSLGEPKPGPLPPPAGSSSIMPHPSTLFSASGVL